MNILPFRFLRRVFRDHSLTFALVFALSVLGVSTWSALYGLLRRLSVPWWIAWILPVVIVSAVANREQRWVPDPVIRRRWSLGLVIVSIGIALAA